MGGVGRAEEQKRSGRTSVPVAARRASAAGGPLAAVPLGLLMHRLTHPCRLALVDRRRPAVVRSVSTCATGPREAVTGRRPSQDAWLGGARPAPLDWGVEHRWVGWRTEESLMEGKGREGGCVRERFATESECASAMDGRGQICAARGHGDRSGRRRARALWQQQRRYRGAAAADVGWYANQRAGSAAQTQRTKNGAQNYRTADARGEDGRRWKMRDWTGMSMGAGAADGGRRGTGDGTRSMTGSDGQRWTAMDSEGQRGTARRGYRRGTITKCASISSNQATKQVSQRNNSTSSETLLSVSGGQKVRVPPRRQAASPLDRRNIHERLAGGEQERSAAGPGGFASRQGTVIWQQPSPRGGAPGEGGGVLGARCGAGAGLAPCWDRDRDRLRSAQLSSGGSSLARTGTGTGTALTATQQRSDQAGREAGRSQRAGPRRIAA